MNRMGLGQRLTQIDARKKGSQIDTPLKIKSPRLYPHVCLEKKKKIGAFLNCKLHFVRRLVVSTVPTDSRFTLTTLTTGVVCLVRLQNAPEKIKSEPKRQSESHVRETHLPFTLFA